MCMVQQFHDGIQSNVQNEGEYSEPLPVTNGVKECRIMAKKLSSMMFSTMPTALFQDCDAGFSTRYCFDCRLFNLRRRLQV